MADRRLIYDDALLPRQNSEIFPGGGDTGPSSLSTADGLSPSRTTFPGEISTTVSDAPTGIATASGQTTSSSSSSSNSSTTTSAPTASASSSPDSGGMPLSIKLVAIIVPIAFVVVLIPILYILWIRYRTRNMKKLSSEPRYSPSPSKEPKFRQASPIQSQKPSFLPPLFNERGTTKEGSLFDEVRTSMESARRNESVGLFDRSRDNLGTKESSYGVYELRRSLEDKGRTDSIGLFDLPRSQERPERPSPQMQPQRQPSPTLPSPKNPLFDRPPSEAWPLPAGKLPSPQPQALYDPHMNTNKPLPAPGSPANMPPPNMPLPAPPGQRQDNYNTHSTASSNILPSPIGQQYRPGSSNGRQPVNDPYGPQQNTSLQASHALTQRNLTGLDSPTSTYGTPTFNPLSPGEHTGRGRQRDSDVISELSYRSPSADRDPKRRSTDAMSVVSAISHRRRRSERDADALSMISALSPDQEDIPRIPTEHYPR